MTAAKKPEGTSTKQEEALRKARSFFYGDWTPFLELVRGDHDSINALELDEVITLLKVIIKCNDEKDLGLIRDALKSLSDKLDQKYSPLEFTEKVNRQNELDHYYCLLQQYAVKGKFLVYVKFFLKHTQKAESETGEIDHVIGIIDDIFEHSSIHSLNEIKTKIEGASQDAQVRSALMEYAKCQVLRHVMTRFFGENVGVKQDEQLIEEFLSQARYFPVMTTESMELYKQHRKNLKALGDDYDCEPMRALIRTKMRKAVEALKLYSLEEIRVDKSDFEKALEAVRKAEAKSFDGVRSIGPSSGQSAEEIKNNIMQNEKLSDRQKRALFKLLKNKILAVAIEKTEGLPKGKFLLMPATCHLDEHRGTGLAHRGLTTSSKILTLSESNHEKASLALQAEQKRNADEIAALLEEETQGLPKGPARWSLFAASKKRKVSAASSSQMSPQN